MRARAPRALILALLSALVCALLLATSGDVASGQDRGGRAGRRARRGERVERRDPPRSSSTSSDDREGAGADPDAPETSDSEGVDATSREISEGGAKVKVIQFSGFDVNGRLKSPQLLYFLNRVRAEFDRPRLPHRSFVPELTRSTKTDGF